MDSDNEIFIGNLLTSEISSDITTDSTECENLVYKPIVFEELISDVCKQLTNALSKNLKDECVYFDAGSREPLDDFIDIASDAYECSSDVSSVLLSLRNLNADDTNKLIVAVKRSESRKSSNFSKLKNDSILEISKLSKHVSAQSKEKPIEIVIEKSKKLDITPFDPDTDDEDNDWDEIQSSNYSIEPFFKFQLPTNLELLQELNSISYLEKYSWVCDSRMCYYHKEYVKYRERENTLPIPKLYLLLNGILANTLTEKQFKYLCDLLELNEDSMIQSKHIFNICAVAERLFYKTNLSNESENAFEISKNFQETIDFKNIHHKMKNYLIKPSLYRLFKVL